MHWLGIRCASFLGMRKLQETGESPTTDAAGVMQRAHISRRTLDRYVADGKLPALYLPSGHRRFLLSDVEALLTPSSAKPGDAA